MDQSDEKEEELRKHLFWCLDQITLKIMSLGNKDKDNKQLRECQRVIKILTSSKASIIKKRQTMRNTFKDYRKKIQASDDIYEKAYLKMLESEGFKKTRPKGVFYKYAVGKNLSAEEKVMIKILGMDLSDKSFAFDFELSDE